MSDVAKYSKPQIYLHWLIMLLVVAQFLSAEAMEEFFDKAEVAGVLAGFPATDTGAMAHALVGGSILLLMLVRVALRLSSGVPTPTETAPQAVQLAARVVHVAFYALLIALPLTGAGALYFNAELGDVHGALKSALLALIAIHIAGALVHTFVYKDGTVKRMLP